MYAEVAVNAPIHHTFDYLVPPHLLSRLMVGHLVQVRFRTGIEYGIVLDMRETSAIEEPKAIEAILDPQPVVTPAQIDLARWMAERYLAAPGYCLWLFLPPGLTGGRDIRVTLLDEDALTPDDVEQRVLHLLKKRSGVITGRRLDVAKTLIGQHWRPAVDSLAKEGVVDVERILTPPRVRPRDIQTAALAIHPDQVEGVARHLGRESRRADVLEVLATLHHPAPVLNDVMDIAEVSRGPIDALEKAGLVTIDRDNKPATVSLAFPKDQLTEQLIQLRQGERPLHVLKVLARQTEPIEVSWLFAQTGARMEDLKKLEEDGLILLGEKPAWRDSLADRDFVPSLPPPLTPEQAEAWGVIEPFMKSWGWGKASPDQQDGLFLLHGVTGSGKTEIYLRAIDLALAQGRQAIYLVPEIALTAQTVRRVAARFPGRTAIVHSRLSEGERYDTWRRARQGLVQVVVGPRSALFTPLPDVGVIILDEEHDPSYKDSQGMPGYHSRDVAEQMMRRNHGTLLLGSATPDVESVMRAQRGELRLLELPTRIMGHRMRILEQSNRLNINAQYYPARAADALSIDLPPVQVVDMREELKAGNISIFSYDLQAALTEVLRRREQAILFINRRGAATYVFCRDCGQVANCPNCDAPLTFHRPDEALRCHRCGHQTPQPTVCPQCGSRRVKYFGAGTQQVESAMAEMFPHARLLRWDADTAGTDASAHELFLQRFIDRKADVLIGTQMIAKGLDIPLVTLVGVVSADMGLNIPDFRAGERTFQLLTQVAGRAGRGLLGGRVILQTYQPEHYAIRAAADHDFKGFYEQEIDYRRSLGYPPFRRLARIVFHDESETRAHSLAEEAVRLLRSRIKRLELNTEIIGPAPCFFSRVNTIYRWQVLLRGSDPAAALRGIEHQRGWHIDLDPVEVV